METNEQTTPKRCEWVGNHAIYEDYHDQQWGRPVLDSQQLFAKLCLDGQQAGLSWLTILKKQANYEAAFFNFDPDKIVQMTDADVETQMQNAGIVRNRLKIQSIIKNARAYCQLREQQPFSEFIWQFTQGKTVVNAWQDIGQVPTSTAQSDAMSKALKKAGFSFVGTTICYAFMQAVGIVNDHTTDCHCYAETAALARR
ncbi:DNA-3-methyladenine glycosylase I [Alteromonas oceanisediminis]|uniref:DNA-3-methyladenine glycosylase I n=1 Tax=Alteromonas oceanisediminis TaxID=2836180 RepID=UPI001BD9B46D|nr:DNA-3-methyladenine glycosylase I [Alteromonas oceanisediminis]MBT0586666.1 DNA-3-methyladenine glycosylase I [Alteromonas oceanisediminis]